MIAEGRGFLLEKLFILYYWLLWKSYCWNEHDKTNNNSDMYISTEFEF